MDSGARFVFAGACLLVALACSSDEREAPAAGSAAPAQELPAASELLPVAPPALALDDELGPTERAARLAREEELVRAEAPTLLKRWKNLRQRISLEPDQAAAHAELGEVFYAGELMQLSEREHLIAVQLDESLGRSHLVLGEIYLSRADHGRALWHLERARRYLRGDAAPYEREAEVLREAGDAAGAARRVEEGLQLDPFHADLRVMLALLRIDEGRHAEAERELRKAVEAEPDHLRAHLLLGQALVQLGRTDEARGEFELHARLLLLQKGGVLEQEPPWPEWRRAAALASYHVGMGAFELARAEAERSLAEQPGNAEATAILSQLP